MLQSLTRFVALYAVLRWLKPRWLRLAILTITLILISYAHSEFITYVEVTDDKTYLLLSFQLKYGLTLVALVGFIISLRFMPNKAARDRLKEDAKASAVELNHRDGFDFLRGKKELDSRSDKILKK